MSDVLPLLPQSALDLSLLVVVLSGVLVLFVLNEAFGWSFGGLVIPGYLASVLVVSPPAGATVLVEAVLTAIAVLTLSDALGRAGLWTPFFGRERFLFVVVVSVLVRQASEVWILPTALDWLGTDLGLAWILPQDAHSVGLVLVPLTANALTKGDFTMGVRQLVLPTVLAFVVLHQVLLQHTNLSLASMTLTYEDVALDFLQSARAYFVLATGALVATLLNGRFAWSAGGILIPALLGLAWYEPARIFVTFGEAIVVAGAFRGLARLPIVRHWNLEGARKLAILFTLAALLRISVGWAHDLGAPLDPDRWAGLGYILSALVAQKILQTGSAPTVILPAIVTSAAAFVGGSAAAWSVEQVLPVQTAAVDSERIVLPSRLLDSPEGVVEYARLRVRLDPHRSPSPHLPAASLSTWRRFWAAAPSAATGADLPAPPRQLLLTVGAGQLAGRSWYLLRENEDDLDRAEGWGVAILRPGGQGPIVLVTHPWSEPLVARAALAACADGDCGAIYFGGLESPTVPSDALEALLASVERSTVRPTLTPPVTTDALPPVEIGDLVTAKLGEPPRTWVAAEIDLEFVSETLVPALASWRRGDLRYPEVARLGRLVGYDTALDEECGPCLALVPRVSGPLVVVSEDFVGPLLVEVPHAHREVGTARIGLGIFHGLGAMVGVFDFAEPPMPVPLRNDPLHALHLGWRRELVAMGGAPAALTVRGLGAPAAGEPRPTEDVVIGTGRPVFEAPPAALAAFVKGDRFANTWSFRWAAARDDERGLAGSHVPTAQADLELGGVTPGILWFSEQAREAWRADDRGDTAEWVAAAGLTLEDGSGVDPIDASRAPTLGAAAFARLAELAGRAAHQHNLNLLRVLVERGGGAVRAVWDPRYQLAFLEVRGPDALARAWLARGDGRTVELPPTAGALEISAAVGLAPADLLLGGAR